MAHTADDPTARPTPLTIDALLRERVTEAVIAQGGFRHEALNAFLRRNLSGRDLDRGALFSEPVIEGAAGFVSSGRTPESLEGELLHPSVVSALTSPGEDYRFDYAAYAHQLEAWRLLTGEARNSVLVSSGTGSGKTECFLVPLLHDLACEAETAGRLTGVRALMLYPLNALIASQEERLRRWIKPFGGRIRFALYNGLMPDRRKFDRDKAEDETPEQVRYRSTLRESPPPILVTNNTMLEYMTIRRQDRPILDKSRGALRWIIIDEAHSYIGSAAAEVSLLLRRALQAFEVDAKSVRFVATSATIGSDDAATRDQLKTYLADLAGVPREQVHVIIGRRESVQLPTPSGQGPIRLDHDDSLARHPSVQSLIREAEQGAIPLRRAAELARACGTSAEQLVEAVAGGRGDGGQKLLPMRVHKFVRAVPGLWSCLNSNCSGDKPEGWPFGPIIYQRFELCPDCGAPAFELLNCRECGEPWLNAFDQGDKLTPVRSAPDRDEFAAASARESDADAPEEDASPEPPMANRAPGQRRLIAARPNRGVREVEVDVQTGALPERRGADHPLWMSGAVVDGACPHCKAGPTLTGTGPLWPFRFGAPFLVQNAAPTLIEGVAPAAAETARTLPAEGRQLLSFNDSRQGTARFAANIETLSERSHVRAFIYHMAQKAAAGTALHDELRSQLEAEAETYRRYAAESPIFAAELRKREELLAGVAQPQPVSWPDAVQALAADPIVEQWIRDVWHERDDRFRKGLTGATEALANFLLLRELNRRPRRANAIETLGLAKLVFPDLEKLTDHNVPACLKAKHFDVVAWRDFLYFLVDSAVRTNFALNISRDDARWILPRKAFLHTIVAPGDDKSKPSDATWPSARPCGVKSTAVAILERVLELDSADPESRSVLNEVLASAWTAIRPLLEGPGSTYALNFGRAAIAPVRGAWLCPVTHRVLPRLAFERTPYGVTKRAPGSGDKPASLAFPQLPTTFPKTRAQRDELARFVEGSAEVRALRSQGVWGNLQDWAATFAPYLRAEEHSAQQPPARLRAFEAEFKKGEINLLACSTTMEMGVDIGSVEVVLNTNVPPSVANYRQRVGRAGRRAQSFASSLTVARDTPLDREAFRDPSAYLARPLAAPVVRLDSARIVQRHANALMLARWFSEGEGQLNRAKAGDFFGYPATLESEPAEAAPVSAFADWLGLPSTEQSLGRPLAALLLGTALEGRADVIEAAREGFSEAAKAFGVQWSALREQLGALAPEAKASIQKQARRLTGEPLLKELANRSLLPSHGFPNAVVPFINDSRQTTGASRERTDEDRETDRSRRYDYPSRNADVAIREYAPGAEVVIDGLVWTSAGVTLNWRRPAHDAEANDIQSIRHYWTCLACGETGCGGLRPDGCESCGSDRLDFGRFLEPAGFRVDWSAEPHADTDQAQYIEPEPPRVSAGTADWRPLLDPELGRVRATSTGRVFHLSRGVKRAGYHICLECGRAEEAGADLLADHNALMPRKGGAGRCPGNDRTYAITEPMALGHEVLTDVVELQPAGLLEPSAAWALGAAVRESLARRLGVESRELGLSIERRPGVLGQATHSVYLFDHAAGGAGYAPRLLDAVPEILTAARARLECPAACERGCSACVLTADLFAQQEIVDRKAALAFLDPVLARFAAPQPADLVAPDALLSPPVADALTRRLAPGQEITLFATSGFDIRALGEAPFSFLFDAAWRAGAAVRLALPSAEFEALDIAARRGLRNASHRLRFSILLGAASTAPNGAALVAAISAGGGVTGFFSRDASACRFDHGWGVGAEHPVVSAAAKLPQVSPVSEEALETSATPGARVRVIQGSPGQPARQFGMGWVKRLLQPELEATGLWSPGALIRIEYSDRYVKSPLPALLMVSALAALKKALAPAGGGPLPVTIRTEPLKRDLNRPPPSRIFHDWENEDDREQTLTAMLRQGALTADFKSGGAPHGRRLTLYFASGETALVFLDQGFGYWRASTNDRHDFRNGPERQARMLLESSAFVAGQGESYLAVSRA